MKQDYAPINALKQDHSLFVKRLEGASWSTLIIYQIHKFSWSFCLDKYNRQSNCCKTYKYLGLYVDQHLDFEKMSNSFCDPASCALSAVMCKMIKNKGFPFNIFEMLYNCCVTSITDYSHDVIGFHQFSGSASIHSNAIRAYLGVGSVNQRYSKRSSRVATYKVL